MKNKIYIKVTNGLADKDGVHVEWSTEGAEGFETTEEVFPDFITAAQFIRRLLEKIK